MPPILILIGALSTYAPGDGHNAGTLACGGRFTWQQSHIAIRQWRRVGCGAKARVCVYGMGRRRREASDLQVVETGKDIHGGVEAGGNGQRLHQPRWTVPGGLRALPGMGARCIWTTVQDSGPWGAEWFAWFWEVQIRLVPTWHRRGVVDLSHALWKRLGSPKFLTKVRIEIFKRGTSWQKITKSIRKVCQDCSS